MHPPPPPLSPPTPPPHSGNGIHRILSAEKRTGRTVLLTTHSMDEADVLCDRIAIVAGGRLRAVGTQQRLKHRFGSGYRLTLHLAPPSPAALEATAARAHAYVIRALSPSALLLSRVGSSMTYVLPRGTDVAAVFGALDSVRGASDTGIAEFGVQQASLEEVFVKVVRSSEGGRGGEAAGGDRVVNIQ
jgi:ABC-type multidrug transport system ATPase subunit